MKFCYQAGVFITGGGQGRHDCYQLYLENENFVARMKPAYAWVQELAECKDSRLPHLKDIRLVEDEGFSEPKQYMVLNSTVPRDLQNAFDEAEVNIEIALRHCQKRR